MGKFTHFMGGGGQGMLQHPQHPYFLQLCLRQPMNAAVSWTCMLYIITSE
jgi:hypothetical protein